MLDALRNFLVADKFQRALRKIIFEIASSRGEERFLTPAKCAVVRNDVVGERIDRGLSQSVATIPRLRCPAFASRTEEKTGPLRSG